MGGWDWETYLSQPAWFIELITMKMNTEGRVDAARQTATKFSTPKQR